MNYMYQLFYVSIAIATAFSTFFSFFNPFEETAAVVAHEANLL